MGFPCQPFALHGSKQGGSINKGCLAALGPIVAALLDAKWFILGTVTGFGKTVASQNSRQNLVIVA